MNDIDTWAIRRNAEDGSMSPASLMHHVIGLCDALDACRAERDAAIQSGWFQAERAERAEARIAAALACISDWAAIPPSVRIVRIERALTGGDA